jgi:site-specific recombinase XerC
VTADLVAALADISTSLGATPEQLRQAATFREGGLPTLSAFTAEYESSRRVVIAASYAEARARVLRGDPELGDGRRLTVYGDLPFTALTLDCAQADVHTLHRLIGERKVKQAAALSRPFAVDDARAHGHGAAARYATALRKFDQALVRAGLLSAPRLADLRLPARPGPSRDMALQPGEVRQYLRTLLWTGTDPELDLVMWLFARLAALRLSELMDQTISGAKPDRCAITVIGKASTVREMPLHRPVIELALQLSAQRPGAETNRLFRSRTGHPVTATRFEGWSARLHAHCPWSVGHVMREHTLRHTTAQEVTARGGAHSDGATLYLGEDLRTSLGTIAAYLQVMVHRAWPLRCLLAERTFGPLTDWPTLTEQDVLTEYLSGGRHD